MKRVLSKFALSLILIIGGLGFMALPSCDDEGSLNPLDFNAFSLQDDIALGQELDTQIKADPNEYPLLNNAAAEQYLQNMADEILKSPDVKYAATFPYKIKIINRDIINAFAAPGGYIYVYTGLIKFLDNEASMAAVLAHEIGHCENRHSTKRITKAYGVQFILDILIGEDSGELTQLGTEILTNLAFLKNSRDDEYEADESSFTYLKATKWYPGGAIFFFNKIFEQGGADNTIFGDLLSTHPDPDLRVDAVKQLISEAGLKDPSEVGEDQLFTASYQQFKNSI